MDTTTIPTSRTRRLLNAPRFTLNPACTAKPNPCDIKKAVLVYRPIHTLQPLYTEQTQVCGRLLITLTRVF